MKTQKSNSDLTEKAIPQEKLWKVIPKTSQVNISGGTRLSGFPCDGPGLGGTCEISPWYSL